MPSFNYRFLLALATKEDIKGLETQVGQVETRLDRLEEKIIGVENKADASLEQHHAVRGDLKALAASVERID